MQENYQSYQEEKYQSYENKCRRCGTCCGAFQDDPCQNLILEKDQKYSCKVYANRLGLQKTISGKEFLCVPIRKILFETWAESWNCAYKKELKS